MTSTDEPLTPNQMVVQGVKRARARRGWSQADLAEQCATAGASSLNKATIANIESGRRSYITVDELFALADVLGVSPVALMVPPEPRPVALTETHVAESNIRLFDWLIGRTPSPLGPQDPGITMTPIPEGTPEWLARREQQLMHERDLELNTLRSKMARLAMTVIGRSLEEEGRPT